MNQRINSGYKIIDSLHIAGTEFVIGYNSQVSMPYVICECLNDNNFYFEYYVCERAAAERNLLNRAIAARNRQDYYTAL